MSLKEGSRMWDFSMRRAMGIMMQTLPFIVLRCLVYFAITLAYILMTGIGSGVGWGIGGFGDTDFRAAATVWGGIAGFSITGIVMLFLREYILYMVKAGHIAVMVNLIDDEPIPEGRSQIQHAQHVVKERFMQANVLFAIDRMVHGVVRAITGIIHTIGSILPIPGMNNLMGFVRAFLRLAVGLIDEVILAYIIRNDSDNPWRAGRRALILYGQNGTNMMKNALWLTFFTYGLALVVFLFCLAPAAALVYMLPGAWSAGGMVFALLFAWAIKAALIEPFAIACLLTAYFKASEGQEPNPEGEERLDGVSKQFRTMAEKATDWVAPKAIKTPELSEVEPAQKEVERLS